MKPLPQVILALFFFFFSGCQLGKHRGQIEQKLAAKIGEKCKPSNPCIIRAKDITDFNWDKLYAFHTNATQDDMNKVFGSTLPKYNEFSRKIIFTKEGKIIYAEDWLWNLDSLEDGT